MKSRWHPGLGAAIWDLRRAANVAMEKHDLTANELIVALAAVASQWLPDAPEAQKPEHCKHYWQSMPDPAGGHFLRCANCGESRHTD